MSKPPATTEGRQSTAVRMALLEEREMIAARRMDEVEAGLAGLSKGLQDMILELRANRHEVIELRKESTQLRQENEELKKTMKTLTETLGSVTTLVEQGKGAKFVLGMAVAGIMLLATILTAINTAKVMFFGGK